MACQAARCNLYLRGSERPPCDAPGWLGVESVSDILPSPWCNSYEHPQCWRRPQKKPQQQQENPMANSLKIKGRIGYSPQRHDF